MRLAAAGAAAAWGASRRSLHAAVRVPIGVQFYSVRHDCARDLPGTGLDTLEGEALAKTIEFNATIGNRLLIVPWIPEERRRTTGDWTTSREAPPGRGDEVSRVAVASTPRPGSGP